MLAYALQQGCLIGVRQELLERIAGQEDQPELVAQVEGARITLHPANRHARRLAARLVQHPRLNVQPGHGKPEPRNRNSHTTGPTRDFQNGPAGLCARVV